MELVGAAVAGLGVVLLLALFTYSPGDPSLNHATGRAPHNTDGRARRLHLRPAAADLRARHRPGAGGADHLGRAHGAHPSSRLLRPAPVAAAAGAADDERGLRRAGRCRRRRHPRRTGRAGRPRPGRPLPRAGADPFERRQPRPDRAGLRGARLHRHGAGARHEPHRPAADLPHPARALPGRRVAGAGGRRPVARQAAVARRGARHAGAADRLCRDPGRDRRQPVRSGAFPAALRADPRRRRTLAGARFADGRRALCADRTAGRRDPGNARGPPADAGADGGGIGAGAHAVRPRGRPAHRADPGPPAARRTGRRARGAGRAVRLRQRPSNKRRRSPRSRPTTTIRSRPTLLPTRRRLPPRAASPSCRASRPRPRASAPPRPASASSISRPANTSCRRSTSCRCPRASAPRPRSTRRRWSRTPACSRPCSTISA